jgi:hypothetical protein
MATHLRRNQGGYRGETIDIEAVLARCRQHGQRHDWIEESIAAGTVSFPVFRRVAPDGNTNVYLSAGIHGDEPAGPFAMAELLAQNSWPAGVSLWLCPCLNPTGFRLNQREDTFGADLNRDYRHLATAEVRAHVQWLRLQPRFDLTLCLHEDWEAHGFYLYELNPEQRPSLATAMVLGAAEFCPTDPSAVIEGWAAAGGIIRPSLDPESRPQWPEALYLIQNKTRLSYTLETPSDHELPLRVKALVAAVNAALAALLSAQSGACEPPNPANSESTGRAGGVWSTEPARGYARPTNGGVSSEAARQGRLALPSG